MDLLNRSALVVKPKQPFLDWLHTADPTSLRLTLPDLLWEPTIYLIPECDTYEDVEEVRANCARRYSRTNWRAGTPTSQVGPEPKFRGFLPVVRLRHHSMLVDLGDEPLRYD
jgi:hypothetical protein